MPKINRDENERFARINEIMSLIAKEPLSTTQIAKRLGVVPRTIQRDLKEYCASYGAKRNGTLWSLDAAFDPNNETQLTLATLDALAKNLGMEFYNKAHSLLRSLSEGLNHPIYVNINAEKLSQKELEIFKSIENAIRQKHLISVLYRKMEFELKPVKIALFDGFWYLLALDGKKFKKFHLKSLSDIKILAESFSIDESLEARIKNAFSVWFELGQSFSVRLHIHKCVRRYFERRPLPTQIIMRENSDKSIEIELEITNIMEIKPIIYHYIPFIRVIEPAWLASELKDEILEFSKSL